MRIFGVQRVAGVGSHLTLSVCWERWIWGGTGGFPASATTHDFWSLALADKRPVPAPARLTVISSGMGMNHGQQGHPLP